MNAAATSGQSEVRALSVARMTGVETACEVLADRGGQKIVAELIGCSVRALYDKREGNTTVSDIEVRALARALAKVAERCARVSTNLFREIGEEPAALITKGPNA